MELGHEIEPSMIETIELDERSLYCVSTGPNGDNDCWRRWMEMVVFDGVEILVGILRHVETIPLTTHLDQSPLP